MSDENLVRTRDTAGHPIEPQFPTPWPTNRHYSKAECAEDECFVDNAQTGLGEAAALARYGWKTARLGRVALDIDGQYRGDDMAPVFIKKAEAEAAGFTFPSPDETEILYAELDQWAKKWSGPRMRYEREDDDLFLNRPFRY